MKLIIREIAIIIVCLISSMLGTAFFEINSKFIGSIQAFMFLFGMMCITTGWRFQNLGICVLLVNFAIAAIYTAIFEIVTIIKIRDGK